MALLMDLAPNIAPYVPGASLALIAARLRDTAIELCRETKVWQLELDPITVVPAAGATPPADQGTYDMSGSIPTAWAGKVRIECIMIPLMSAAGAEKQKLFATSAGELDEDHPRVWARYNWHRYPFNSADNWRGLTHSNPGLYFSPRGNPNLIRLVPLPSADGQLDITVAVKPLASATEIGDDVAEDHYETLADGCLARMLNLGKQPWYEPDEARRRAADYARKLEDIRRKQLTDNQRDDWTTMRGRVIQ